MQVFQNFQANGRPRYLQCEKTVQEEIGKAPKDNHAFFAARYAADARSAVVAAKVKDLLKTIRERRINVFAATGAISAPASKNSPSGQQPASPRTGTQSRPPPQAPR